MNLDFSEWGDAFPDNRILGAATLDRLRHGAYRVVIEGESFRNPRPMPENGENAVAKKRQKTAILKLFESAFYPRFCWRHYDAHPRRHYAAP
jgi:hypothetical protein